MLRLGDVNEPYEVIALLDEINNLITTLSKLTDTQYYTDYIFNAWTGTGELIKGIGIDNNYLVETLEKFEKLRIVLFGDCIDWSKLAQEEMRNVARAESKVNKNNEEYIRKLQYQLREQQKKGD